MRHRFSILLCFVYLAPTNAEQISTAEIIADTYAAAFACMNWQPTGLCLWLQCDLGGCRVESSIKIGHYQPDLVVSVYPAPRAHPWRELRPLMQGFDQSTNSVLSTLWPGFDAGYGGARHEDRFGSTHKTLRYAEADAIGHPLSRVLPPGVSCASETQAFSPYLLSVLDAFAWRSGLPDQFMPASVVPGLRELGDWPASTWGAIYPRSGWAHQPEPPKAAALLAQRAGDIVTRRGQAHVYRPTTSDARDGYWPPGPLLEGDPATGIWQMLRPTTDRDCAVFGGNDLVGPSWSQGRNADDNQYSWNLWRPYQCCERRGQWFLGDIQWLDFP